MAYRNLNTDPELLRSQTKDDESRESKYKTETHDHEKILKTLKVNIDHNKKKHRKLNRKNVLLNINEVLIGSGSAIGTPTKSMINPSIGIVLTISTALLTSIAILITKEYISEPKIRYTKLKDWINVITLLYEKTLKTSMVDKKNT